MHLRRTRTFSQKHHKTAQRDNTEQKIVVVFSTVFEKKKQKKKFVIFALLLCTKLQFASVRPKWHTEQSSAFLSIQFIFTGIRSTQEFKSGIVSGGKLQLELNTFFSFLVLKHLKVLVLYHYCKGLAVCNKSPPTHYIRLWYNSSSYFYYNNNNSSSSSGGHKLLASS